MTLAQRLQRPSAGRVIGVRMRANDIADVAARRAPQPLLMFGLFGAGIDDHMPRIGVAHDIAVGSWAGHDAAIVAGQALHVAQQRHCELMLPVEVMQDLAIWTGEGELAERRLMFHEALLAPGNEASARTADEPRLLVRATVQHVLHTSISREPLERAYGREDDQELSCPVAFQCVSGTHPHRLELLGFVGHGLLALGHTRDQERHVEAARQIAIGDPVGEQKDLVGREHQAVRGALRGQWGFAVEGSDVFGIGVAPVRMPRQQDAELLETLPDGGDGLCQARVVLCVATPCVQVRGGIGGIDAATGKHIGAGGEACRRRAARHQYLQALRTVAQQ